jgi:hypothetical protein
MVAAGTVTGMAMTFDAAAAYAIPADVIVAVVDNNACRLQASRFARARAIRAVFSMLVADSMRMHTFLQGPYSGDACLWCAAPNLDPRRPRPAGPG